ncbi:hypothetical protein SNEBB_011423 [Seison nebaliae]|nr:hypothetical protein SNEBB_011423 [Seison nebaliae]
MIRKKTNCEEINDEEASSSTPNTLAPTAVSKPKKSLEPPTDLFDMLLTNENDEKNKSTDMFNENLDLIDNPTNDDVPKENMVDIDLLADEEEEKPKIEKNTNTNNGDWFDSTEPSKKPAEVDQEKICEKHQDKPVSTPLKPKEISSQSPKIEETVKVEDEDDEANDVEEEDDDDLFGGKENEEETENKKDNETGDHPVVIPIDTSLLPSPTETIDISMDLTSKKDETLQTYVVYQIITQTNIDCYRFQDALTVWRRYSDFLGLYEHLLQKYESKGTVIMPIPPQKSVVKSAKMKINKEEADFIEKRRLALLRWLQRLARHPAIRRDTVFVEFLSCQSDLPKSSQTSSISGAGLLRMMTKAVDVVSNIQTSMEEEDQWFEKENNEVNSMLQISKNLYEHLSNLSQMRKDVSTTANALSTALQSVASHEDDDKLTRAFSSLADVFQAHEKVFYRQSQIDLYGLAEVLKDKISCLEGIKVSFDARSRAWQTWTSNSTTLGKKHELLKRLETQPNKRQKVILLNADIEDLERRVNTSEKTFEDISKNLKVDMKRFKQFNVIDFEDATLQYTRELLTTQKELHKLWEEYNAEISV